MFQKIDDLQKQEYTELDRMTITKINELAELSDQYQANGVKIEIARGTFIHSCKYYS